VDDDLARVPEPDGAATRVAPPAADLAPSSPSATVDRRVLAVELAVVLFVVWLPAFLDVRTTPRRPPVDVHAIDAVSWAGWVALAGYLAWRRGYLSPSIGVGRFVGEALRGAVVAIGMLALGMLFVELVGSEGWGAAPLPPGILAWVCLATGAAAEEVLWRGYAFGAFSALAGPAAAVFATAALFAVYHPYGPLDTLSVGIIGLFLGALRAAGAGLVALSVGHFLCNGAIHLMDLAAASGAAGP